MKVFVTVGGQLPFDRLVLTVDAWAALDCPHDVFAQIGDTPLRPPHLNHMRFLDPPAFGHRLRWADVIISHAGMGTIITALEYSKPILIMPRRADLREHRNDHQIATARALSAMGKVEVAMHEGDLTQRLRDIRDLTSHAHVSPYASPGLLSLLREFIHDDMTE
jgi:UDP-N-acetylglucosamine transferase subunit ALG13